MEYSRYNAKTKYEWVCNSTYSSDLLCYTDESHEGFCWVLCDWSFQVLGEIMMDEGVRSKNSLSLGMTHGIPRYYLKEKQRTKLGDARVASPLSSNDHQYFTWSYIFIRHISWVLLGASCMIRDFACFTFCFKSSILAEHTWLREPKLWYGLLELLSMVHLNLYEHGVLYYFQRNSLMFDLYLFES